MSRRPGVLALLFAASLVAKLLLVWQLHDHPLLQPSGALDDGVYLALARRVLAGDLALGPDVYFVSPFYVYFLAGALALCGGSLLGARALQALLGACGVVLVAATGRQVFGERSGLAAGCLALLTGVLSFNEVLLLQSAVDPVLTALVVFLLALALAPTSRLRLATLAGLAGGLLVLNRPNALPAIALVAVLTAALGWSRRGLARAGALSLGVALALAPVAIRNRVVAGEWILVSSHGGLNFYIGNNALADGSYRSVPGITPSIEGQARDAKRVAESAVGHTLSAAQVSDYFYREALSWILSAPFEAGGLFVRKLAYVLNQLDLALNYSYSYFANDEQTVLSLLRIGPWLLVPLGFLGFLAPRTKDAPDPYGAWAVFAPAYAVSVAAFFVSSRYRLPLLVMLCIGAGAGLSWLVEAYGSRRFRGLAVPLAGAGFLAVVANVGLGVDHGRASERTEMVARLIADGRVDEGRALLARAERNHPQPALLAYRAARAFQDRGDLATAVPLLEKAAALEPGAPDIRYALGLALLDSDRPEAAVRHLSASSGANAPEAERRFALARALAGVARDDEARVELRAASAATDAASGESWLALGRFALRLRDPELAVTALEKAVAIAPQLAPAHEGLGLAFGYLGRSSDAQRHFEQACRLDPGSASARLNLAVLFARGGRLEEARARAREALAIRPDYEQARVLLRELSPG